MFHRLLPLINRAWSSVRPHPEIAALAERVEILCPEEEGEMTGVCMDASDWQHVTGFYRGNTEQLERSRVRGGKQGHRATIRYHLRNVLAAPSGFHLFGASHAGVGGGYLAALRAKDIVTRPRGFYASSAVSSKYFGHWLLDAVPTAFLRADDEDLYLWSDPAWGHAREYVELLGIERVRQPFVHFERMTFCEDVGQNSHRRARLRHLKSLINTRKGSNAGGMVYLRRGRTGESREIANEHEVEQALSQLGFVIVDVRQPLREILDAAVGARVTVSMEGSNFAHLMLAASPGALHVVINPSDRFNNVFADYLPAFGDRMTTTLAKRNGHGYQVDVGKLLACINEPARWSESDVLQNHG